MKVLFKYVLIIVITFYLPLQSMAWGMIGHRVVGGIADSYLTPKAKAEIKNILGNESIAMASNWADFIRSDSTMRYLDPWHYVNVPGGLTLQSFRDALAADTAANAYNKMLFLISELKKKNLSRDKKAFYLKLLIHIASDVAQPLHVSATGTRGGNDVKVQWFSTPTNLHALWDSHLIEHQQLSYTEYINAINFTTAAQRRTWQNQPLTLWLYESYEIAQQLHSDITTTNPRLGYEYNYKYLALLNQQLLKGGVRLAKLLNDIFGK